MRPPLPLLRLLAAALALPAAPAAATPPPVDLVTVAEVLLDRTVLTAAGPGAYELERTLEVRVLHPAGAERFRGVSAYYDDATAVEAIEGSVQAAGARKPIRSRKRDVRDAAAYDGFSIARSGRYKRLRLPLPEAYPAVYRTRTVRRVREDVGIPPVSWDYGAGVSVVSGEFVLAGEREEIRYLVVDPDGVTATAESADGTLRVSVADLPAREDEDFAPRRLDAGPAVLLAPRRGRLEGVEGDFTSWAGLGAWTAGLLAERSELPPEAAAEVRALVAEVADPLERIRLVYDYVQQRTHYVSIQLGLGGFQPMEPATVHASGYGDCKALTNYTRLLLAEADVESYYCEVGVGERQEITQPNFASAYQTNHVMLAVPLAAAAPGRPADTMWLECTSQTMPAGFAGGFGWAAGRRALLVDEAGGRLVRVPGGEPADNPITSSTEITLAPDGSARFARVTHYAGAAVERPWRLSTADAPARRRMARAGFAVSADGLEPAVAVVHTPAGPVATVREAATLPSLARRLGDRLLVPAFGYLATPAGPADTADRQRPFAFEDAYRRVDSVRYVLPQGQAFTATPAPAHLTAPHARYDLTAAVQPDGSLLAVRRVEFDRGTWPARDAGAIGAFYRDLRRADAGVLATAPAAAVADEP